MLDLYLVIADESSGLNQARDLSLVLRFQFATIASDGDGGPADWFGEFPYHTPLLLLTTTRSQQAKIGRNIVSVYGDVENVNTNGLTSKDLQLQFGESYVRIAMLH